MGLRALEKRCVSATDICPDTINDKDSDHIDPAWEQTGNVSAIIVDSSGWQTRAVTFPAAFPTAPNFLLHSIKRTNPPQPSGLKVFVYPSGLDTTGFNMHIDVNASCTISGAYMDVSWLARRI